ncbi:lactonase family protein [Paracidovorax anthurii]|uniref:6-phosphogluconolactonase (Cycloisomerase 2 family) n=1 Tax=Paracidovorax anthurii TaxID=78229 RepID=A0A328ZES3_9BURK|nr:lactonase family protein [Paracidovorax anthurii]RAR84810.1 6-phosphogluconolactonase (cycloisomerase 2 family) [Paracidovorax anthurii]
METNPWSGSASPRRWAFVGCRTSAARNAQGTAIEVYERGGDGAWRHAHSVPAGDNPSYLALDAAERFLHAVHGDGSSVSSFAVRADGTLQRLGNQSTEGLNPVHLSFSPCGRWVVVANYATGSVVSLPVRADGSLGTVACKLELPDAPGPHRLQQRGSHPHQVVFDPSGNWLLVPDKGGDAVHTLTLDAATGALRRVASLHCAPCSGPRHLVFDRSGTKAWVVLELSSQVLSMHFDPSSGILQPHQRIASVPESFTGESSGAGILITDDGEALCVSNRGHGSVCVYAVGRASGVLSRPVWIGAGGLVPRFICQAPAATGARETDADASRTSILVANEDAHTIVRASVDSDPFVFAHTGSPVCVVFTQGSP